ncbi:unnamed protein product [Nesidiocoris tenuis]|uniref:Uncharacterized protein n=1 Tax=Nesidiocoris tenuis TaxID=355587 RepID=A0A6H5GQQ6_9HEMI|nr:unnamed protein product [Nesidiocoris tenuis]
MGTQIKIGHQDRVWPIISQFTHSYIVNDKICSILNIKDLGTEPCVEQEATARTPDV